MYNKRPLAIASDPARRQATLGLLLAGTLLIFAQSVLANTPTIRLFPTTVVEDLKQTGNVARDMETGLQEVIGRDCFKFGSQFSPAGLYDFIGMKL